MKKNTREKGITLIALVVSVIILLILAGVTLNLVLGNQGILGKARKVSEIANESEISEQIQLAYSTYQIAKEGILEEFMSYNLGKIYGVENVKVTTMGVNCKIDILKGNKIYILKRDGDIKEIPKIEKMEVTKVYGKLDENNKIVYLRATNSGNYDELKKRYANYDLGSSYDASKVNKIIIEEPIAPSALSFYNCSELTIIQNIENLHTENMTSFDSMFYGCINLEQLDVSGFDTSNIKNAGCMFWNCKKLKNIDVSNFDTSKMTNMASMFQQTYFNELDLSSFNTERVTTMNCMFRYSGNLSELDIIGFDTKNVENMGGLFNGCSNIKYLDLSNFNTSKVTVMDSMFCGCENLEELNISSFDTSKVGSLHSMFMNCKKLKNINLNNWDTSKVTDFYSMFYACNELKNVDLTGKFKIDDTSDYRGIFSYVSYRQGIIIKTTQDIADKIISTGNTTYYFTMDNFEIV